MFLLLTAILLPITVVVTRYFMSLYSISILSQLIVANHTIHLPFFFPSRSQAIWFKGITISEYNLSISDNVNGIPVSTLLIDPSNLITQNTTVVFDLEKNRTISSEQRSFIPLNYLENPTFCFKGSSIETVFKINRISPRSDNVEFAFVYFFIWRGEADIDVPLDSAVHRVNITSAVNKFVTDIFNVVEDSYYYFILHSKSDADYDFTSKFIFHVLSYVLNWENIYNSSTTETTITRNHSVFVPFNSNRVLFLYAHLVSEDEQPQIHLHLSYSPCLKVQISVISISYLLFLLFTFFLCVKLHNLYKNSTSGYTTVNNDSMSGFT